MDGNGKKPCGGNKTARPAPATDATQQQPAAQAAVLETPALSDDAAAAQQVDDDQPDVASVDESRGGGGAEEEEEDNRDDDEQVERFYAVLANIRAMRGLAPHYMACSSSCGGRGDNDDTDTDTAGAGDYEEQAAAAERGAAVEAGVQDGGLRGAASSNGGVVQDEYEADEGHGPRPTMTTAGTARAAEDQRVRQSPSSSSSMPHAVVRFQQSDSSRSCSGD